MGVSTSSRSAHRGISEVDQLVDLDRILDPEVHAVLWRRGPIPGVEDCLARPECRFGDHSRLVAYADERRLRTRIEGLLPEAAHRADPDGMNALIDDVETLCDAFATLLAADELMISFEAPTGASCPRFHVDRLGIRMLVTYRGPGTEILPDEFADRSWLGPAGHGLADEQTGVILPSAQFVHADPFDVVLLKGEAWPNAEGFGVIHRSPDPKGAPRTMLRVDMLSQLPLNDETD